MPGLDNVSAKVNYSTPPADGSKPYNYVSKPPAGVPSSNYKAEEYILQIENVRGKEDTVSLDQNGFYFGKHPATHTAFSNDEEIAKEYYPESIDLIKQLTGAAKVVLFDHSKFLLSTERDHDLNVSFSCPPSSGGGDGIRPWQAGPCSSSSCRPDAHGSS